MVATDEAGFSQVDDYFTDSEVSLDVSGDEGYIRDFSPHKEPEIDSSDGESMRHGQYSPEPHLPGSISEVPLFIDDSPISEASHNDPAKAPVSNAPPIVALPASTAPTALQA